MSLVPTDALMDVKIILGTGKLCRNKNKLSNSQHKNKSGSMSCSLVTAFLNLKIYEQDMHEVS